MSFEKLPTELIVKIFKCLLIPSNVDPGSESNDGNVWKKDMPRLRLVCKRFNAIINYELQESLDLDDRFPCFYIWCIHEKTHHPVCWCDEQFRHDRGSARFKHIKIRALDLTGNDLLGCFARCFREQTSSFSNIEQLHIYNCKIDLNLFHMIIRSVPKLKVLIINGGCSEHTHEPLDAKEWTGLTLNELMIDQDCPDQLYEYIIRFLPAREVIFTVADDHQVDRKWADRYLIRHKEMIRSCSFYDDSDDQDWNCHCDVDRT